MRKVAHFLLKSDLQKGKLFRHFLSWKSKPICSTFPKRNLIFIVWNVLLRYVFNAHLSGILIHKMCMDVTRISLDKDEMMLESSSQLSAASLLHALLLTRESNQFQIVKCIRPHILFSSRHSQPTSVHQSVSVGHYLLHPNNREFNQGTRPALANHGLRALLLTPDLSTHTMFRPYISAETSASFFFSFQIYPESARGNKNGV